MKPAYSHDSSALARAVALLSVGIAVALAGAAALPSWSQESPPPPTMGTVLEGSAPSDWRVLDQANTIYVTVPMGRVVISLAPAFAPMHVANIKALVTERFYDGPIDLLWQKAQRKKEREWLDPPGVRFRSQGFRVIPR